MELNIIDLRRRLLAQGLNLHIAKKLHIAILNQPYLDYIINGKKTIESRFTKNCVTPYNNISKNDIVLMKEAGKKILFYFIAGDTFFYKNSNETFEFLKERYSSELCADEKFWLDRADKKFISLISVQSVNKFNSDILINKKDKRGWVTICNNTYKKLILISGKIASGKTWLAMELAKNIKADRCSFSDYIKWKCLNDGKEKTRENLDKIGQYVIENEIEQFIYFLLNCATEKTSDILIIDGLRHLEVIAEIKKYCKDIDIVFIDSNEDTIKTNLLKRGEVCEDSIDFETEKNLSKIKAIASIVIKNSQEIDKVLDLCGYTNQISIFDSKS